MEVHRELGMGFKEAFYKDALELDFDTCKIPFRREKPYIVCIKKRSYQKNILQTL